MDGGTRDAQDSIIEITPSFIPEADSGLASYGKLN
jgi:hypothetical protein